MGVFKRSVVQVSVMYATDFLQNLDVILAFLRFGDFHVARSAVYMVSMFAKHLVVLYDHDVFYVSKVFRAINRAVGYFAPRGVKPDAQVCFVNVLCLIGL